MGKNILDETLGDSRGEAEGRMRLGGYTVKNLVVILTTIPCWLIFITTLSSLPLDDTVVTHVISIGNWNLDDESVVTNDERVVN